MRKIKACIIGMFCCLLASTSMASYFPKNDVSIGYFHHTFFDTYIPHPPSPLFWQASTKMEDGVILTYQRLIFNTVRYFSMYAGFNTAWYSINNDHFNAASLFVSMRFWFLHLERFGLYLSYSIAGPSYLSQRYINKNDMGSRFIFQDYLGIGMQWGKKQAFHFDLRIVHYSNGDIFPINAGFDVPVVLYLGYSF